MFLGHFALAFGAKKAAPAVSLGALFLACQFADLLWPVLVLLGVEEVRIQPGATAVTPLDFVSYPYSHSLIALVGWGILVGGAYTAVTRSRRLRGCDARRCWSSSHWVLDVITHRPDMPLTLTRDDPPRPGPVELDPGDAGRRAAHLRCGDRPVLPGDRGARSDRVRRPLVARRVPGRRLRCERVRTATAGRADRRVVGDGDVAARRCGGTGLTAIGIAHGRSEDAGEPSRRPADRSRDRARRAGDPDAHQGARRVRTDVRRRDRLTKRACGRRCLDPRRPPRS